MKMENSPTIISTASIVGSKEGKGPLKDKFDVILQDDLYGEKTWELAESKMIQTALETAVQKAEKQLSDIHFLFGGDLINQIFPASFAARELQIPFCGIYGAFFAGSPFFAPCRVGIRALFLSLRGKRRNE